MSLLQGHLDSVIFNIRHYNLRYKYVKPNADNLIKNECAEADFMEKSRKNWRLAD